MEKKPGGRPPERDEAKRSAIAVRTTPATKDKLSAAAAQSGRSLTQEIEQRLERSIELESELGGPEGLRLFRSLAFAIQVVEYQVGDWRKSPTAFAAARDAVVKTMEAFAPTNSERLEV